MVHVYKLLMYLLIWNTYVVCVRANEHQKFVNGDNDFSEIFHEDSMGKSHKRSKRDVGFSTAAYYGSLSITLEASTFTASSSVTTQTAASTSSSSNPSTAELTTGQASLIISNTTLSTTSVITETVSATSEINSTSVTTETVSVTSEITATFQTITSSVATAASETTAITATAGTNATSQTITSSVATAASETTAITTTAGTNVTSQTIASSVATAASETTAITTTVGTNATSQTITSSVATAASETTAITTTAGTNATSQTITSSVATAASETTAITATAGTNATSQTIASSVATAASETTAITATPGTNATSQTITSSVATAASETTAITATAGTNATSQTIASSVATAASETTAITATAGTNATSQTITSSVATAASETTAITATAGTNVTSQTITSSVATAASGTTAITATAGTNATSQTVASSVATAATNATSQTITSSVAAAASETTAITGTAGTNATSQTIASSVATAASGTTAITATAGTNATSQTIASSVATAATNATSQTITSSVAAAASETTAITATAGTNVTSQTITSSVATAASETTAITATPGTNATSQTITSSVATATSTAAVTSVAASTSTTTVTSEGTATSLIITTSTTAVTSQIFATSIIAIATTSEMIATSITAATSTTASTLVTTAISATVLTSVTTMTPTTTSTSGMTGTFIVTTILTSTNTPSCNSTTQIQLSNNTCLSKMDLQMYSVNILRNGTNNSTGIANALSYFFAATTNVNISWNPYYILSPSEIEGYLSRMNNITLSINSNTSFIMSQPIYLLPNVITEGAIYTHNVGGQIGDSSNANSLLNSGLTAGAIIRNESLVDATYLNMLIIDKPTTYENVDNSSNQTLASSVIVVSLQRNSSSSTPMNISLYFQVLTDYRPTVPAMYSCAFYDLTRSRWNISGCTVPIFNNGLNRYECSCNHLSTFALTWSPNIMSCNADTEVSLSNGTCVSKSAAQILSVNTLRSNSTNATVTADALSLYISSITNSNTTLNSAYVLSIGEVDMYLSSIANYSLTRNTNQSFLMAQSPYQSGNVIILGASFSNGIGGQLVTNGNQNAAIGTTLSAAATIRSADLIGVTSLNMLIIDDPSLYRNIDNSTNKTLASSLLLASVKRNSSQPTSINISLYFQPLTQWQPNTSDVSYYCSFYDTNSLQWNESGCTAPTLNTQLNRYECSCNHLTSFALIWLPNVPLTRNLDAQDIASIVFESISIVCFFLTISYAIISRLRSPVKEWGGYDLLPMISSASTTILFIFHIALGMTVYTTTSSENQTQCFLSSSVLMFFVYFFLIFMFCTKTSVGYFNYLRFVQLFPQPSRKKLFKMLLLSFMISITCVAIAAGLNSNSSFHITQLYPYKLCWFTRDVLYYFLTIPVCLFLFINILLFIFVAKRIIDHVRNSTTRHQSFKRMKQCVTIVLASCITQGIGWLFGPFLTFANPTAGNVLGWFFVVFNGLEGLWTIILYIVIQLQHMDEQKRLKAIVTLKKSEVSKFDRYKASSTEISEIEDQKERQRIDIENRGAQQEVRQRASDLRSANPPINDNNNPVKSSVQ